MSRMTKRGVLLVAAALFAGGPAVATPFYVRYDADETFPEQEGWTRFTNDYYGQVRRTLTGEALIVDSSASAELFDSYFVDLPDITPATGERLEVSWRMRTTFDTTPVPEASDVVVTVINAEDAYAILFLGEDFVADYAVIPEPPSVYPVTAGAFHEYRMVADMASYQLYVDGQFAFSGVFHGTSWTPGVKVLFGDSHIGQASVSEWDYVEVQVVPEPGALAAVAFLLGGVAVSERGGRR